jgi:myosin protein heavy chain
MAAARAAKDQDQSDYYKYMKYKKTDSGMPLSAWSEKSFVWVPVSDTKSDAGYVQGEVIKEEGDYVYVRASGSSTEQQLRKDKVFPMNPPKFDGVEDCAELSHLNEPSVFHNLKKRYEEDLIYTYSGLFCVVINPYKRIPIYTPYMVEVYRGRRRNELAPHIFAVTDEAYRNLVNDRENQSMLITGESGAGKTENTKKVIQYLATIAGQVASEQIGTLEQQILEANPILEAFGNAKTLRNDNSSRFGKFIRVQFNAGGIICGANIDTYLLERNRVVWQAKGERSFHIFYQLCAGASIEMKKKYSLGPPETFGYLAGSGCVNVPGVDDRKEFAHTCEAMEIMGFSEEDIDSVFRIVSGILHLSNLPLTPGPADTTVLKDKRELNIAAGLLQVNADQLENALLRPRIKAGTEIVSKALNLEQTLHSRDALSKAIYGRLFLWIVRKINEAIGTRCMMILAACCTFRPHTSRQARANSRTSSACWTLLASRSSRTTASSSSASTTRTRSSSSSSITTCSSSNRYTAHHFISPLPLSLSLSPYPSHFPSPPSNPTLTKYQEEYLREQINWTFIDFGMDSQDRIGTLRLVVVVVAICESQELIAPRPHREEADRYFPPS